MAFAPSYLQSHTQPDGHAALDVTAHVERLPSGQYVGFIRYVAPGEVDPRLESFRAGVFDEPQSAYAAARRLMNTFIESVLPPGRIAA
jgi:hypothetical protein